MLAAFALALFASTSSVPQDSRQDIIVVGRAIQTAKDSLAACLARRCAPNEDIDATLALAESQLVAGKYRDARSTLLKSLGRNKKQADAYPIPVSDLYRANGRVAANLGIDNDFNRSTWGIYRTLKHGLPNARELHYSALMEVAEMLARTRNHQRARLYYERIADQARKDGRPDIAALAELRMTLRHLPPYMREAGVRHILSGLDPSLKAPILEGKLALARIAYENHEAAKGDAVVRELASLNIRKPILIYAPPYELAGGQSSTDSAAQTDQSPFTPPTNPESAADNGTVPGNDRGTGHGGVALTSTQMALNVEDMWIDVGFHISPDGKVQDLKIERKHGDIGWARPLLLSIAGRRYTPAEEGAPESYRKERYTFTSGLEPGAGTKMAQHSPVPRVEYFDLSDISAPN
jgi:tetratricopeptide (TPR) repeat protein